MESRTRKILCLALACASVMAFPAGFVRAAPPEVVRYQARLTDAAGVPLAGTHNIAFAMFAVPSGGTALWCEGPVSLTLTDGVVDRLLGEATALPSSLFTGADRWLEVTVDGSVLSPRQKLASVPYAHAADRLGDRTVSEVLNRANHSGTQSPATISPQGSGSGLNADTIDDFDSGIFVKSNGTVPMEAALDMGGNNINKAVDIDGLADQLTFSVNNSEKVRLTDSGNVGIGTISPVAKLHVEPGSPGVAINMANSTGGNSETNLIEAGAGNRRVRFGALGGVGGQGHFVVQTSIDGGVSFPEKLRVASDGRLSLGGGLTLAGDVVARGGNPFGGVLMTSDTRGGLVQLLESSPAANALVRGYIAEGLIGHLDVLDGNNNKVEISGNARVDLSTGGTSRIFLDGLTGTITTQSIVATTCCDLAEVFPVTGRDELPPGSVVIIDEENPGRLRLSERPYDKRVAGIVSGAGGLEPGLVLRESGATSAGTRLALTGRVHVMADTTNGPIAPGDLLTTSGSPGRAMRATDAERSLGAILGKAMTHLPYGEGWVLVLVALQ